VAKALDEQVKALEVRLKELGGVRRRKSRRPVLPRQRTGVATGDL